MIELERFKYKKDKRIIVEKEQGRWNEEEEKRS